MIFFFAETPDGWAIPGVHGPWADDELDGYVQGAVYLIRGLGENMLIDTGNWSLPEFDNSMGEFLIDKLDREKNPLKYIFITHSHYDHVGNAAELKKRYGAKVLAHPLERPIIEDPFIVTRADNITRFGMTPEQVLADFNLKPGESLGLSDPSIIAKYWNFPVEVDMEVKGGDILEVGGLKLQVIDLPGHAAGQVGVYNPKNGNLYSADILHYPSPLGPYPIGNARAHTDTIQRCIDLKPQMLLEGHGLCAFSEASAFRRLNHMRQQQRDTRFRIPFVLQREGRPMTTTDLVAEVMPVKSELDYPVFTGLGMRRCYAECCVQTHLVWHIEDGAIERVRDDGKVKFVTTAKGRDFAIEEYEARRSKDWS